MLRLTRWLTALLGLALLAANGASAVAAVSWQKTASGSLGSLEYRFGGNALASSDRFSEKLASLYDLASDFPVAARATAAGGRALVPAVDAVYATATERLVAGYNVWGTAGRVGSTYNVNILGLYATEGSQGLGALVGALRAEAAAAGASRISIQGLAVVNEGLAGLSARAAARFGLQLERVNGNTIILSGGL